MFFEDNVSQWTFPNKITRHLEKIVLKIVSFNFLQSLCRAQGSAPEENQEFQNVLK